jgi:hypothetical protein
VNFGESNNVRVAVAKTANFAAINTNNQTSRFKDMIKHMGKITLAAILAAVVLGLPLSASAQDMKPKKNETASKPSAKTTPFNGKLEAIDKTAKTVTLAGKTKETFSITSETKIMKDGKPATFDDATPGETIHGSYKKTEDGKMVAVTLNFGKATSSNAKSKTPSTDSAGAKKN